MFDYGSDEDESDDDIIGEDNDDGIEDGNTEEPTGGVVVKPGEASQ